MATLESVERATLTVNGKQKEGLKFTWIVNGMSEGIARTRARVLTAKAFPLQIASEMQLPGLELIETQKIDERLIEPRPIGPSGLVKAWRVSLFMSTENDALTEPVEAILDRASEIIDRGE